ncbi:MAG: hypothetical protein OEY38_22280 [Gammaproteobacteria bacterium]|nr:hypothetical protein [Gammaproteobacteria bacterium]
MKFTERVRFSMGLWGSEVQILSPRPNKSVSYIFPKFFKFIRATLGATPELGEINVLAFTTFLLLKQTYIPYSLFDMPSLWGRLSSRISMELANPCLASKDDHEQSNENYYVGLHSP